MLERSLLSAHFARWFVTVSSRPSSLAEQVAAQQIPAEEE